MSEQRRWGIIGGTWLDSLSGVTIDSVVEVATPYGPPSAGLLCGQLGNVPVAFLPRHGAAHSLPPHRINYRANIWALSEYVDAVIAVAAVGGINAAMKPGDVVVIDQVIDYTSGRSHTYWDEEGGTMLHVDFTQPYSSAVRHSLLNAGADAGVALHDGGVYGATQGPRLESAAEINRLEKDGCDVVGMTGMPEAGLARELSLPYACCAVIVNPAAGRGPAEITMEMIEANLKIGMERVHRMLCALNSAPSGG
ncbi:MAG: S-methyl-5'-thioinosine phosphorylase [Chromatiales bacterium]|nr:S-methyl-5'-thioinosine phosphorylase [Chromatiales bacterium]